MVNEKLITVFLANASKEDLINGINAIMIHFKVESEYNFEDRVNNLVNIVGGDKVPTIDDIDIELLKENIGDHVYNSGEINKDSIKIIDIDPIDYNVIVSYIRGSNNYSNKDRIPYTKYLKKVKEN